MALPSVFRWWHNSSVCLGPGGRQRPDPRPQGGGMSVELGQSMLPAIPAPAPHVHARGQDPLRSLFRRLAKLDKDGAEYSYVRNTLSRLNLPSCGTPPPFPRPQRADGGHRPGRHDRPDQGDQPFRPGTRGGIPHLRDADGRRRDQAVLPGHSWAVRVPRRLQELRLALTKTSDELAQ